MKGEGETQTQTTKRSYLWAMNSRRQTFFLLSNGTSSRSFPHVGQRAWYIDIPADLAALWASHCTSSMRKEDEMVWGVGSSLWAWISLRSKLIFRRLNSRSGWASVPHTVFDGSHVAGDTIWSYPPSKVFLLPTHIFFFFFLISDFRGGIGSLPALLCGRHNKGICCTRQSSCSI